MNEHSKGGVDVAGEAEGLAGSIGEAADGGVRDALTNILRKGAVGLLAAALRQA